MLRENKLVSEAGQLDSVPPSRGHAKARQIVVRT